MKHGLTLVTGASGFLGRHVVEDLARDRPLRVLVRGALPWPPPVETIHGDILDRAAVRRAVAGVEDVVHLAARVHVMRDRAHDPIAEFRRANVEGTELLATESVGAGVRRFLLASSVRAVTGAVAAEPLTCRTPERPEDPYGISKLEAERVVRRLSARHGLAGTILRFPLMYGPHMKGNVLRLFSVVARGVPLPLGSIDNRRSLLYVENAVAAIRGLLDAAPAGTVNAYFVSDDEDLSTAELVRRMGIALGRPARLLRVPPALFRAAGWAGDRIARVIPFPLTTPVVERLLGSLVVDAAPLWRAVGARPPFTVTDGLDRAARWFHVRS